MNLVIAEPSLASFSGHFFEYAAALRRYALEERDWSCRVLASRQVDERVCRELEAVPCFRRRFWFDPTWPDSLPRRWRARWRYHLHARSLAADLAAAERHSLLTATDVLLVPTAVHSDVAGLARWLARRPPEARPRVALVFHFTLAAGPGVPNPTVPLYRHAFRALAAADPAGRARLFADSAQLAAEYGPVSSGRPVTVLPIPHAQPPAAPARSAADPGPAGLVYLGDARIEKGFDRLPEAFARVRADLAAGRLVAEVQTSNASWRSGPMRQRVCTAIAGPGVRFHEHPLSTAEYHGLLARADLVLLPYCGPQYRSGTSGIFCEALAAGKVVAVPADTWMAAELGRAAAGGVIYDPVRPGAFGDAVAQAVADLPALRARAAAAAPAWCRRHSLTAYFQALESGLPEP